MRTTTFLLTFVLACSGDDSFLDAGTDVFVRQDAGDGAVSDSAADARVAEADMSLEAGPDMQRPDGGIPVPPLFGARPVTASPLSSGTLFAAPDGLGEVCSLDTPCSLQVAAVQADAGDVLFLRDGVYPLSDNLRFRGEGTAASPIVVESYPGEHAILDASAHPVAERASVYVYGQFYRLRRLEIRNMTRQGVLLIGTDNRLEGLEVHHNHLSGIQASFSYDLPYGEGASRNTIVDCVVHHNFDEGREVEGFNNGGNADGISISNGIGNRIEHCTVYMNSDDGLDAWRSIDTYFGFVLAYENGLAEGDGNGIKAGGREPSANARVEHCLSYNNLKDGVVYNGGANVTFRYNTAYNNGLVGFEHGHDTTSDRNLEAGSGMMAANGRGEQTLNSWQQEGSVSFVSEVPGSADFLRPSPGGDFEDLGAYAGL